jgi:hypothetical protein
MDTDAIKAIQAVLGVTADGVWGPKTQAALDELLMGKPAAPQNTASSTSTGTAVKGYASSFADPADVTTFKKCKAQGHSDDYCFGKGDNGIGCWGDDTTNTAVAYVAIQPDYMIVKWGTVDGARHKLVDVTINGQTHTCLVGDRMPWVKNTTNGAVIDLAPGAQKLFGLHPPFLVPASWEWA